MLTSHQVSSFPSSKYAFSLVTNNRIDFNKGKSTTPEEPHRNDHPLTNHLSSVQQHSKQARTDRMVDRHTTCIIYILPSPSLPPYDGLQLHSDHHSLQLYPMTDRLLRMKVKQEQYVQIEKIPALSFQIEMITRQPKDSMTRLEAT